jgi:hypothetical protein
MAYYLLPKTTAIINVNPCISVKNREPYVSYTALKYHDEIKAQVLQHFIDEIQDYNDIIKLINPHEYIFSKVPGTKLSVSKLKSCSNLFYEFLETVITTNAFENYTGTSHMRTLCISQYASDIIECLAVVRDNYMYENTFYNEINDCAIREISNKQFDFLFFETSNESHEKYFFSLIHSFMLLLKNQENNGHCIIRIHDLFYKSTVDIMFLLTSLYEKVYIIKPQASNVATFDKYIVCKKYRKNEFPENYFVSNYNMLYSFLDISHLCADKDIKIKNMSMSILDYDEIPCFFKSKINDINIIFGQSQIESLDLLINIVNNKNKEEKIQNMKKSFIQKSILWCEKFKIPCNRFYEKVNIFLPVIKEDPTENEDQDIQEIIEG